MGRVQGKVALVTGAALGLGRATALMLASEGAAVVVTDVKEAEGRSVVKEITQEGGRAAFFRHDVSSEADWRSVIAQTVERFGGIDILVNNAGVVEAASFESVLLERWRWLMGINLDGVLVGMKYAVEAMKRRGGGSIINLSSVAGLVGDANLAAYNASKGAVRLLTKSAALHCAKAGYKIRVNSIHPGAIATPMVEQFVNAQPDPEAALEALTGQHPLGVMGEPDDVAYGVLYLASDESKFITGSELVIDGGFTAQ